MNNVKLIIGLTGAFDELVDYDYYERFYSF